MTDKLRDLTAEDREWIDARADQLYRDSERQRGGIRPATIMAQDFRDYFVAQAAWERARAALAAAPQPAIEGNPWQALERIDQLARLVAHDLQGRVEGSKVAAVLQCADMARTAMDTPKGGGDE